MNDSQLHDNLSISSAAESPVKVFLTGATGVMGSAGLKFLTAEPEKYAVTVLARDSKRNRRKLLPFQEKGVKVIWGDLTNPADVEKGVRDAEIVLHVGGMVSPAADWYPEKTIEVNVSSMKNIVDAIRKISKENPAAQEAKVIYIGSVSQYGNKSIPNHWGEVGDPLFPAKYDAYAYSKIEAERILAESGIKRWVSLRQTGILHPGLLMKASDPIAFHVPIRGVLEWVTAEDSGRLLERVCHRDVPEDFWCDFYNIGGGESYRMTNYEFECKILKAIGCPPPEKVFKPSWFATQNFHGMWYRDSDRLEDILHFRSGESVDEYFSRMVKDLPFYFKLTPLAPSFIIRSVMKRVANTPKLGTLWWLRNNDEPHINAAFGSREEWQKIGSWDTLDLTVPPKASQKTTHSKDISAGGKVFDNITLLGEYTGDDKEPLPWKCNKGHNFTASMHLIYRGGHRCPHCVRSEALL